MADELSEFLTTYDYLVRDVQHSGPADFAHQLSRWFAHVETDRDAAAELRRLEERTDLDAWLKEATHSPDSFGAALPWSTDEAAYLSEQISICRAISRREMEAQWLVVNFMYQAGHTNAASATSLVYQRVFDPMARDFKRRLRRILSTPDVASGPSATASRSAPAADRLVRIDHNAAPYIDAISAVDAVETALVGINDYPDPDERTWLIEEIREGRRMLSAPLVRVLAVSATLGAVLAFLSVSVEGFGVDLLASAAMIAVDKCLSWAERQK